MSPASAANRTSALALSVVASQGTDLDGEWAADRWDASRLGVPARFDTITQHWSREPVKRWSRFRLATGCAFGTISSGASALSRFSCFLSERHPNVGGGNGITRPVLEDYMAWLVVQGYSAPTRALSLSMLRVFFDACHRHGWLPGLAPNATIYVEELPFHHDEIARFVPEFVMAQLEADAALAKLPHRTTRNLVIVLIETGLRGGDACNLLFGSVFQDSTGWPCLRFEATKVRTEQLVPLSAKAAAAIADQQAYVAEHWPGGSPWSFPGLASNDDGSKPYSHSHFTRQLVAWEKAIDLRDQAGQAVRVTGHQFRHTLVIYGSSLGIRHVRAA
ncbi:MAG: tyrosine-type recombinase/integrase [Acidimicrobiales bacterium]